MGRFTDEEVRRYSRQMVLPEVGGIGQERLRSAHAMADSELEALYLAAAGVGKLTVPTAQIADAVRALNPNVSVSVNGYVKGNGNVNGNVSDVERASLKALRTLRGILAL
jgi:hypothetical protein